MTTLLVGFALGMRHGTDPDHLAAIDGLSRIRPRATNGLFFALGHGLVVTMLAVGMGQIVSDRAAFLGPWVLILIGFVNLAKLLRKSSQPYAPGTVQRPVVVQPFLLGMILAAGFETASQFSMLILAGKTNPWLLGAVFTGGMVLVDGFDGYLAASTQNLAATNGGNARNASRLLGILVVIFSFGLGGAELLSFEWERFALPLGLALFAIVIAIRVWARSGLKLLLKEQVLVPSQSTPMT
jgi:nickel/cobalt transporter (NiCoT) family protein